MVASTPVARRRRIIDLWWSQHGQTFVPGDEAVAPVEGLGWSIVGLGVDPDVPNPMPDKPGQGVGQQGAPHADPLVVRVDGQTLDEPVYGRATG